jgi:hypothetical protein
VLKRLWIRILVGLFVWSALVLVMALLNII